MWFSDNLDKQIEEMSRFNKAVEKADKESIRRKKATVNYSKKISEKILDKKERKKLKRHQVNRQRKKPRSYGTYIKSKLWTTKKNKYWQKNKKICRACGSAKFIHLHHAVYSVYDGSEKDRNLFPLCKICHKEFHDRFGARGNMLDETLLFIEGKKSGVMEQIHISVNK